MILIPRAIKAGPHHPWAPKRSTKIMPAMTGETEKGMSRRVKSTFLPGKRKRVTAQAAATPKNVFKGTAAKRVNTVRKKADRVPGSDRARPQAAGPLEKA